MQTLPLNGFYSGESRKNSDRRCINFIPTISDSGSLSQLSLMPSTGIDESNDQFTYDANFLSGFISSQVASLSTNFTGNVAYFVVGRVLVGHNGVAPVVQKTLAGTPIGGGSTTPATAYDGRFATDGLRSILVAPSYSNSNQDRAWILDEDLNSTAIDTGTIMGTNSGGLIDVAFFGGRFLYLFNNESSTDNAVYYSSIGGTDPNVLDFFRPDSNNEQLKGMSVISNSLYLFSETKTYIYQVTASTDLPFQQVGVINYGLYNNTFNSANAKTRYKGTIAFVGREEGGKNRIYLLNGGSAQVISTPAIDYKMDCDSSYFRLFSFSEKGRYFLCVRGGSFTYVYESDTGIWHERESKDDDRWEFIGAASNGGKTIFVGDMVDDVSSKAFYHTGLENPDIGNELGNPVERTVISSPFNANNDRMIVSEIEPQCEVDYTVPDPLWPSPKVNMSLSYDFGYTFESERSIELGRAGNYRKRTRFTSIGYVDQAFTVKIRTLCPYPVRIIKLLSRTTKGGS
jgi:hypothetical protein